MMIPEPGETDKYIKWLKTLTDEQRLGNLLQLAQEFCVECGRIQPGLSPGERSCQCANDEQITLCSKGEASAMSGCPDCDRRKEEARLVKERGERDESYLIALIGGGLLVGLVAMWIGSFFTSDQSKIGTIGVIGVIVGSTLGVALVYLEWKRKSRKR